MINTVNQNLQYLLPLDLELSNEGLKKWLQKRTIHRNRAYVSNFLSRLGLNEKDTKGIIDICQGLSLNVSITKPDRKSTRLNSSHTDSSRMPSSA